MNLTACLLALILLQGAAPQAQDPVVAALERLGIESISDVDQALGREPAAEDAKALATLALHLTKTGEFAAAEPLWREALRMRRALYGETDKRTLYLVHNLSKVLGLQGRYSESIAIGTAALEEVDRAAEVDPTTLKILLNNHAVNLQAAGELFASERCYRQSLDLISATSGRESADYATFASNFAILLGSMGRVREAREFAEEALKLRIELFGDDSIEAGRTLVVLGEFVRQQGDFFEAEACVRKAERIFRSHEPPDELSLSRALEVLGLLAMSKGDFPTAAAAFSEARTRRTAALGPDHPDIALCSTELGTALLMGGQWKAAMPIFQAAVESSTAAFGPGSTWTLQARAGTALALEKSGDVQGAIDQFRGVLADLPADALRPPQIDYSLRSNLARCLVAAGDSAAAELELRTAIAGLEKCFGIDSVFLAEPRVAYALLLEARGDLEAAEAEGRKALAIASAHRNAVLGAELERSLFSSQLGHGQMSRLLARLCIARGDVEGALAALEEGSGRHMLDGLLRARRDALRSAASPTPSELDQLLEREELARAALRELQAQESAQVDPEDSARAAFGQRIAAARNVLSAATAAVAKYTDRFARQARPASLERIRSSLGEREVLLSFLWSDHQVSWIVVGPGSDAQVLLAGGIAGGKEAVLVLEREVAEFGRGQATDPRSRGQVELRAPEGLSTSGFLPALEGARRVYVVPDGPLSSLPFDLLLDDGGPSAREVVMLPSASTLVTLSERARSSNTAANGKAVVLGDPDFGTTDIAWARSGRELLRLPATGPEAKYVATLLEAAGREVRVLLGAEATRAKLESACERVGILHLATHGFPGTAEAPFDAALALATGPSGLSEDWSDALTLDRLVRRWSGKLDGCELVVLSACETNREVAVGTGMYSLATGFFHAGAQAVLASLWRVDEQATALLMGRFFENVTGLRASLDADGAVEQRTGEPAAYATALREAKTWLRTASRDDVREASQRMGLSPSIEGARSPAEIASQPTSTQDLHPYADPYFWAGFVLIGRAASDG
jgi:CHAT domain-containing protein